MMSTKAIVSNSVVLFLAVVGAASCTPIVAPAPAPIQNLETAVVLISHTQPGLAHAAGSGFIVNTEGLVVTADHVVYDEQEGKLHEKLFARRYTGAGFEDYSLSVVKRFRTGMRGRDIAILRIEDMPNEPLPVLNVGGSAAVGSEVLISGFPLAFDQVYALPLVRRGIVSSLRYIFQDAKALTLDLPGASGYSGAPIVDTTSGMVIGVFKGSSPDRPTTDFSIAFELKPEDISNVR